MKKIVVVAPTYNEVENIEAFIRSVLDSRNASEGISLNLLISDSRSTDGTVGIVKKLQKDFPGRLFLLDISKRGLGLGLFKGIDYAVEKLGAQGVITMEADLSHDPKQMSEFIKTLETSDLVVGSRYCEGGKIVNWSWWRRGLSKLANLTLQIISGTFTLHEFTNLYRSFNASVWRAVKEDLSGQQGWLFVPVFLFTALGKNIKTTEIPIVYHDRFAGGSKMSTPSYTKDLLLYVISYRLKKSASFFKFLVVGGWGFVVNTTALIIGVKFGMVPANAGAAGAELAIISNFVLNNLWTFSDRKLTSWKEIPFKFLQFNFLSLGSVVIQFSFLKAGEFIFGLARYKMPIINLPIINLISRYMFFYVMGVGVGLIWNFFMYSKVIWKKKK